MTHIAINRAPSGKGLRGRAAQQRKRRIDGERLTAIASRRHARRRPNTEKAAAMTAETPSQQAAREAQEARAMREHNSASRRHATQSIESGYAAGSPHERDRMAQHEKDVASAWRYNAPLERLHQHQAAGHALSPRDRMKLGWYLRAKALAVKAGADVNAPTGDEAA